MNLKAIVSLLLMAVTLSATAATEVYVSTTGNDAADGSKSSPVASLEKALTLVDPSGTIYINPGTYYPTKKITLPAAKNGTETARTSIIGLGGPDQVIIDGSKGTDNYSSGRAIYIPKECFYWYIKGITIQNAHDNGIKLEGSYNIIEHCVFRYNNDTGLQMGLSKEDSGKLDPNAACPWNPDFKYCAYNKIINCDSYGNCDMWVSATEKKASSKIGENADGFACKLFPGPGNEFYGCRAWNNTDDSWDNYQLYHPLIIDHCWSCNAGYDINNTDYGTQANGNGFKLGGNTTGFTKSQGAHLVRNSISFGCKSKGFDYNNNDEGVYLINNVAWDNGKGNYYFPTMTYGNTTLYNCIGFNGSNNLKKGYTSENNSWDISDAKDFTSEFTSISFEDFKAPRNENGDLPEKFARLKEGSIFIDKGKPIKDFVPKRHVTADKTAYGAELMTAPAVSIEFLGSAPDLGAFEYVPRVIDPTKEATLTVTAGNATQTVTKGMEITPVTLTWGGAATDVNVSGAEGLTVTKDATAKTVTISGKLNSSATITVSTTGAEVNATQTITLTAKDPVAAKITASNAARLNQTKAAGRSIESVEVKVENATGISYTDLPAGITCVSSGTLKWKFSGSIAKPGVYTIVVKTTGGDTEDSLTITLTITGDATTAGTVSCTTGKAETTVTVGEKVNIIWTAEGDATGIKLTGDLPQGVTSSVDGKVLTISGTATAAGSFSYTVTSTGADSNASATGSITVNDKSTPVTPPASAETSFCHFNDNTPSMPDNVIVKGNYSNSKGSVDYNGTTYKVAVKMESTTEIRIIPPYNCIVTLYFTDSKSSKLDGQEITPDSKFTYSFEGTGGTTYTLTKKETSNLLLVVFTPVGHPDPDFDNDWYHIQDPFDQMTNVFPSDDGMWQHGYNTQVPDYCTQGAVVIEPGQSITWHLTHGISDFRINMFAADGAETLNLSTSSTLGRSIGDTNELKAGSHYNLGSNLNVNLMTLAGISEETRGAMDVTLANPSGNKGAVRIHDYYLSQPMIGTGIESVTTDNDGRLSCFVTDAAIILNTENVAVAELFDINGRMVSRNTVSQILPRGGARGGVYIVRVATTDGRVLTSRVILK